MAAGSVSCIYVVNDLFMIDEEKTRQWILGNKHKILTYVKAKDNGLFEITIPPTFHRDTYHQHICEVFRVALLCKLIQYDV